MKLINNILAIKLYWLFPVFTSVYINIHHFDQKVPGITTRWCSESADLNSVFLIRLPLSIIDIPTKFYHHSLTFVKVTSSWVYLPLHVFSILDLWENNSWILHHDNAPSHSAIIIREFFTKNETNNIQQSSNSPDMAPCDFFLFDQKNHYGECVLTAERR